LWEISVAFLALESSEEVVEEMFKEVRNAVSDVVGGTVEESKADASVNL
jgi:hypothetical protein